MKCPLCGFNHGDPQIRRYVTSATTDNVVVVYNDGELDEEMHWSKIWSAHLNDAHGKKESGTSIRASNSRRGPLLYCSTNDTYIPIYASHVESKADNISDDKIEF